MDPVPTPIEPTYFVPAQKKRFPDFLKNKWVIIVVCCLVIGIGLLALIAMQPQDNRQTTALAQPTDVPQPTVFRPDEKKTPQVGGQAAVDADFTTWEKEVKAAYPWIQKLPVRHPNAFVYFDINRKKFIGLLYTRQQKQADELKLTMLGILKDRDVTIDDYPIDWIVVP